MTDSTDLTGAAMTDSPEDVFEVVGEETKMSVLIEKGTVVVPEVMAWNEWQRYRKTEGPHRRPTAARDGKSTTAAQEVALWHSVMTLTYGEQWHKVLVDKETAKLSAFTEEDDVQGGSVTLPSSDKTSLEGVPLGAPAVGATEVAGTKTYRISSRR